MEDAEYGCVGHMDETTGGEGDGTDGGMEEIDYLALMPGGVGLNLINNK